MSWYSGSESVCCGATVIESPVCTPIGSTFSTEQTTIALSATSRITSSSNSFQPRTDCSSRMRDAGLACRARVITSSISSRLNTTPPPSPPSVKLGRTMTGKPSRSMISRASLSVVAVPLSGTSSPASTMARLNSCRSSPSRRASTLAPRSVMPDSSNTPDSDSARVRLIPVWPPTVGSRASGRSRSMIFSTTSGTSGST